MYIFVALDNFHKSECTINLKNKSAQKTENSFGNIPRPRKKSTSFETDQRQEYVNNIFFDFA